MSNSLKKILLFAGYFLAFLTPIIGIIAGLILFLTSANDEFYRKHGKWIMIIGAVVFAIYIAIFAIMRILI